MVGPIGNISIFLLLLACGNGRCDFRCVPQKNESLSFATPYTYIFFSHCKYVGGRFYSYGTYSVNSLILEYLCNRWSDWHGFFKINGENPVRIGCLVSEKPGSKSSTLLPFLTLNYLLVELLQLSYQFRYQKMQKWGSRVEDFGRNRPRSQFTE